MTVATIGRPSLYRDDVAAEICDRLAKGESLVSICADETSGWLPSQTTVYRWLDESAEFRERYARARELQAETFVDEIVSIADQPNARTTTDGEVHLSDPVRDRLRMDARKWVASKLAPKKYGEKITQEVTGADGEPFTDPLAAAARLAAILAGAEQRKHEAGSEG